MINSEPQGATVIIDSHDTGLRTPNYLEKIPYGEHKIELRYEHFQETTSFISINQSRVDSFIKLFIKSGESKTYSVNGVSFVMKSIAPSTVRRGQSSLNLAEYWISETEVTYALWDAVMQTDLSSGDNKNLPVTQVSRSNCDEFISKLNTILSEKGRKFMLPTELQWEHAAYGGVESLSYSSKEFWNKDNSEGQSHGVKTNAPNGYGIYNMSGNVWEWCRDNFVDDPQYDSFDNPCMIVPKSKRFVAKGGSYKSDIKTCRIRNRISVEDKPFRNVGFRLILE
jgi:formylglycine-generating enzyme required for sulfatase activity